MHLQAVKIALEVKKYLIDNDQFDVSQVENTELMLCASNQQTAAAAVMTRGLPSIGES